MNNACGNLLMEIVLDSDIGGTNKTTELIPMDEFEAMAFTVQLGDSDGDGTFSNWNSADELDSLIVKEYTSSAGAGTQTLDDYSANTVVDNAGAGRAAGTRYQIEVGAEELSAGYTHIAVYVAEATGTGTDNCHITATAINPKQAYKNRSGLTSISYVLRKGASTV